MPACPPPSTSDPAHGWGEGLDLPVADTEAMLLLGRGLAGALVASGCEALVLDLRGELGAGKTVLVRGLARGLGVPAEQRVVSPTFTIARAYALRLGGRLEELHHVDAYRLTGADDLDGIGFEAMCGIGRLTCVEWGERVEGALPMDRLVVSLSVRDAEPVDVTDLADWPRSVRAVARGPGADRVLVALRRCLREPDGSGS